MSKETWTAKSRIVDAVAVTPSDTVANEFDALYIGTGGDVEVVMRDGSTAVTFTNVPDGSFLPANVKLVKDATTATDILGLTLGE